MEYDIKKIQKRLLEMALKIRDILEKNNINYSIMYGTLLGAVRHQGFIPWDDDFDFILFDETYEKSIKILKKELPNDILIEDEESEEKYYHAWARAKCKKTIVTNSLFPFENIYKNRGLTIDLYCGKKMKLADLENYKTKEREIYLNKIKNIGLINEEKYKEILKTPIFNKKSTEKDDQLIYGCPFKSLDRIHIENLLPFKRYLFEGEEFWGPKNSDEILKSHYGNYQDLPEEKDRKPHYDRIIFLD